jgi:hypothetical protein
MESLQQPRAAKTSSRKHESAVALPKRAFAAPAATETVLPGANPFATVRRLTWAGNSSSCLVEIIS